MKIEVTPSSKLPVSITRQAQIIDGINHYLDINPRQSFMLIGSPGTGKTFTMNALRKAAKTQAPGYAFCGEIVTLAEWHQKNRINILSTEPSEIFESSQTIERYALQNADRKKTNDYKCMTSDRAVNLLKLYSLHFFLDEFDSQPSDTDFTRANFQTFLNKIYENTGRQRAGNQADFVQAVFAMNKTMAEFQAAYGQHAYRRIPEMCVVIDFDKAALTEPVAVAAPPVNTAQEKLDKEVERLLQ